MSSTDKWFLDLDGNSVEPGSLPVMKIFVIDPKRKVFFDEILWVCAPDPWEQVVITNADDLETFASFAGAFPSKAQARKAGFSGSVFHGFNLFGTKDRSFFIWNPEPPKTPPTFNPKKLKTEMWWNFLAEMDWIVKKQPSLWEKVWSRITKWF